jgi:protein-tyrosine kinase
MSLVEQAIAKLRKSGRVIASDSVPVTTAKAAPAERRDELEETSPDIAALIVDNAALRASGYLPEEGQERRFAEYYRHIKRPLLEKAMSARAAGDDPSARVIMVTSALPGEGKSFTSVNLAFSMARERDISLLLIDADVLKPRVSELFGVRQEPGLMDALLDESLRVETLVMPTTVAGLSILPAGRSGDGTAELLSSNRMRQILAQLMARDPRRVLLVDSPPILITSEGKLLTKIAGQIVLVVRGGQTSMHAVREVVSSFGRMPLGGIVINEGRMTLTEGFYGYGNYGNYGTYGSQSDAKSGKKFSDD